MKAYKVKCTNCGRKDFETTDKFDPDKSPNGAMVKCLLPYMIDWLPTSTTKAPEMTCPECLAPLAPGGFLNVLIPARDAGEFFACDTPEVIMPKVGRPVYICEICGKEVSSALALNGHRRSHKEGKSNG